MNIKKINSEEVTVVFTRLEMIILNKVIDEGTHLVSMRASESSKPQLYALVLRIHSTLRHMHACSEDDSVTAKSMYEVMEDWAKAAKPE